MRQQDALISGSFAFQYFERVNWEEFGLDIFIGKQANAEVFCRYLSEEEGYVLTHSQEIEVGLSYQVTVRNP